MITLKTRNINWWIGVELVKLRELSLGIV